MSKEVNDRNADTVVWVEEQLVKIETDDRYSYPPATIVENAPLAMIQLVMKTQHETLTQVYERLTGRKRKGVKPHGKR